LQNFASPFISMPHFTHTAMTVSFYSRKRNKNLSRNTKIHSTLMRAEKL
jgi:hypothetical protein